MCVYRWGCVTNSENRLQVKWISCAPLVTLLKLFSNGIFIDSALFSERVDVLKEKYLIKVFLGTPVHQTQVIFKGTVSLCDLIHVFNNRLLIKVFYQAEIGKLKFQAPRA